MQWFRGKITLNGVVWLVACLSILQNIRLANQVSADRKIFYPAFVDEGQTIRRVVGFDLEGKRVDLDPESRPSCFADNNVSRLSNMPKERAFVAQASFLT
jgi:hypothetical protein